METESKQSIISIRFKPRDFEKYKKYCKEDKRSFNSFVDAACADFYRRNHRRVIGETKKNEPEES